MPRTTLLSIFFSVKALKLDTASSRSNLSASLISWNCASTLGSCTSPLLLRLARTFRDSSQRSWEASQRGEYGQKKRRTKRRAPGTAWTPQGMRKAEVGWSGSVGPLPMPSAQPYWMKYWMRMPQVMAHC